ncbi:J domain-containing protein [Flavobacterium sp.]|uniref:J domain-containing protein n=1 Tax=Flavobacterium sp. TaxID=239 RepID=UPI00391CD421
MTNHYKTLGVKDFSSLEEIKTAYKKLSKKFHPDVNDGDKFFEERFKDIQESYEYLKDTNKKRSLDDYLTSKQTNNFENTSTETKSQSTNESSFRQQRSKDSREELASKSVNISKFLIVAIIIIIVFIVYMNKKNETDEQGLESVNGQSTNTEAVNEPVHEQEQNNNSYEEQTTTYEINSQESFTIGSNKEVVLSIQGNPTSTMTIEALNEEIWYYESSSVTFKNGKVKEYSNFGDNLNVKYSDNSSHEKIGYSNESSFSIGSNKNTVLNVQGNPTSTMTIEALNEEIWYYESSSVTFKNGKVKEYSNFGKNLNVQY